MDGNASSSSGRVLHVVASRGKPAPATVSHAASAGQPSQPVLPSSTPAASGTRAVGEGQATNATSNAHSTFNPLEELDSTMLSLLDCARLSPSFLNSQPWLFMPGQHSIRLFLDQTTARTLAPVDPDGRLCYMSLGCAVESLVLVAQADGLSPSVQVRHALSTSGTGASGLGSSVGGAGQPVDHIEVTLDPISLEDPRIGAGVGTSIQQADALARVIRDPSRPRHTLSSTAPLDGSRQLSGEHLRLIKETADAQAPLGGNMPPSTPTLDVSGKVSDAGQAVGGDDAHAVRTVIVTEPSVLAAISSAAVLAERDPARSRGTAYDACIRSFLHPVPSGMESQQDGRGSGTGPATGMYSTVYEAALLAADGENLAFPAAACAILCTSSDEPVAWIQAGRAFLRLACACAQAGVAVAWLHDPAGVREPREKLAAIAQSAADKQGDANVALIPQLVVRLGYPAAPSAMGQGQAGAEYAAGERTGRKPLSEIIMRM